MLTLTEQILWLAINAYFEAAGEPMDGKVAVTHVVLNRAFKNKRSVKEVLIRDNQFSWVPSTKSIPTIKYPKDLIVCVEAVYECLEQRLNGNTLSDANLYYNFTKVKPYWAEDDKSKFVSRIGKHEFRRE